MTKLMARSVEDAKRQMEASLKRWNLDSVDLMQFHAVARDGMNVVDDVYNKGLIEWAMEQHENGKTPADFSDREKDVFTTYMKHHTMNKHKMLPIPICVIPQHLM